MERVHATLLLTARLDCVCVCVRACVCSCLDGYQVDMIGTSGDAMATYSEKVARDLNTRVDTANRCTHLSRKCLPL